MRVAIINFHRAINYGAVLQAYALEETVRRLGHDCVTIDYRSDAIEREYAQNLQIRFDTPRNAVKNAVRLILNPKGYERKKEKFELFLKRNLHLTRELRGGGELSDIAGEFDAFICGSDQVWNPKLIKGDYAYLLPFAPNDKGKIAYAASFGIKELGNEDKKVFRPLLKRFDSVSVRESSGLSILENLGITNAQQVLDPTFLLDYDDWSGLKTQNPKKERYLLYYCMGETPSLKKAALELSKKTGLPIVNLKPLVRQLASLRYRNVKNAGPLEFLSLLMGADYVVTNSFHGTAFAINFRKPFWTGFTGVSGPYSTDTRILSLLESFGLESRLLPDDDKDLEYFKEIDFGLAERVLNKEKEESLAFLRRALS